MKMAISRARHNLALVISFVSAAVSLGCQTSQSTRYYFAAASMDDANPTVKFYRVTVSGCSFNSRAEMQTGWYDAAALHDLFGQVSGISAEANGKRSCMMEYDGAESAWKVVDGDKRFTVIYGANADALADQVRLFAESDAAGAAFGQLLAGALAGRNFETGAIAERNLAVARKANADIAAKLKEIAGKLDPANKDLTPEKARLLLLQAAQLQAGSLGSATVFSTTSADAGFKDAQTVHDALRAGME